MENTRRIRKIKMSTENMQKLAAHFGIKVNTLYGFLTYRSNSDLSELVRSEAIKNYGGVLVREVRIKKNLTIKP